MLTAISPSASSELFSGIHLLYKTLGLYEIVAASLVLPHGIYYVKQKAPKVQKDEANQKHQLSD